VKRSQGFSPIAAAGRDSETHLPHLGNDFLEIVTPDFVNLDRFGISTFFLSEGNDPPSDGFRRIGFLDGDEPSIGFIEALGMSHPFGGSRTQNVEDEQSARKERRIHSREQASQSMRRNNSIKLVVEYFTD
jgi:hypothetical protein